MCILFRSAQRSSPSRLCAVLIALTWAVLSPAGLAAPERITIFAAASLTEPLQRVSQAFSDETGIEVRHSFAASSTIARQIENGARADVFISADDAWMDYLETRSLIARGTRTVLLGNRLALIAPTDPLITRPAPLPLVIRSQEALQRLLLPLQDPRSRLILADPQGVPLGRYSRAALESLETWDAVRTRLAIADNARTALALVARGESPLGIVYETDAMSEDRVRILGLFDEALHPPIVYPAAATLNASPTARRYLDFLRSGPARRVFIEAGFQPR